MWHIPDTLAIGVDFKVLKWHSVNQNIACQRIVESRDGRPGREAWLLARRSVSDPTDIAYYVSNAPIDTPLLTLAQVASTRYTVEQCIEEAKGETGLDEYEVRFWHSWHRHITLSLMAHTWLASARAQATEKKGAIQSLFSLGKRDIAAFERDKLVFDGSPVACAATDCAAKEDQIIFHGIGSTS